MEKRTRILVGLVSLVLFNLAFCSVVQAAPAQVSVSPASVEVSSGDTFTVDITVDPKGNEVYGAQYALYFNNNLLKSLTVTNGTFLSQDGAKTNVFINETNNTIGRITFGEARTGIKSGVTNSDTLASISFKVIGTSGTSYQKLDNVKLTNPNAELIEIETKDGTCIIGEVTGEPAVVDIIVDITVYEAHVMMEEEPEEFILLDVQTVAEYEAEHIDMPNIELKNIPKDELKSRLGELEKTKKIIVYCKNGGNSRPAGEILVQHGFESVYNMLGGVEAWRLNRDFPVYRAHTPSPSLTSTLEVSPAPHAPESTTTPTPSIPPSPTASMSPPEKSNKQPGFEAAFTIIGLLAIAYLVSKRKQVKK
jgi:PGF-CTERM protein